MEIELDTGIQALLKCLAEARHTSPETILREAVEQLLDREEKLAPATPGRHPSGKPWPRRNPVGGIITPV